MLNSLHLYLRYLGVSARSQMQYRFSLLLDAAGHFLAIGTEILCIWALFHRFGSLRGWRFAEIGIFYGVIHIGFALAEGVGRGFDVFPGMVQRGDFDRLLLRPRSTAFQVAAGEVSLMRVGRLAQGLVLLLWSAGQLDVDWNPWRVALLAATIVSGACLFYGLFVLQATLSFWTVESLELFNTITYGGTEAGSYPLSVYRPWFRRIFTFIVPLAAVSYFPILVILGRPDTALGTPAWFGCIAPLIGVAFLVVALRIWNIGVRHYRSTGS